MNSKKEKKEEKGKIFRVVNLTKTPQLRGIVQGHWWREAWHARQADQSAKFKRTEGEQFIDISSKREKLQMTVRRKRRGRRRRRRRRKRRKREEREEREKEKKEKKRGNVVYYLCAKCEFCYECTKYC